MRKEFIKCNNREVGLESAILVRGRSSPLSELLGFEDMGGLSKVTKALDIVLW